MEDKETPLYRRRRQSVRKTTRRNVKNSRTHREFSYEPPRGSKEEERGAVGILSGGVPIDHPRPCPSRRSPPGRGRDHRHPRAGSTPGTPTSEGTHRDLRPVTRYGVSIFDSRNNQTRTYTHPVNAPRYATLRKGGVGLQIRGGAGVTPPTSHHTYDDKDLEPRDRTIDVHPPLLTSPVPTHTKKFRS